MLTSQLKKYLIVIYVSNRFIDSLNEELIKIFRTRNKSEQFSTKIDRRVQAITNNFKIRKLPNHCRKIRLTTTSVVLLNGKYRFTIGHGER